MRTSLRDPDNNDHKTIVVPDRRAADFFGGKFPGATILKLETGITEEAQKGGKAVEPRMAGAHSASHYEKYLTGGHCWWLKRGPVWSASGLAPH